MIYTHDSLSWAHPLVHDWFINKYSSPTEPQIQGWPSILAGQSTLISAPTGSGKTFAAFLICIDQLVRQALEVLTNQTTVIYISPLKALTNDVQKNLLEPLKEIQDLAIERGFVMQEIRAVVRTGDTLPAERQAMIKKPPQIVVTTPESFYLLLTAEKSRAMLKTVTTVIVDEIHALANNKRGSHLSLSLERLDALSDQKPIRIGLSATQKPLELVADFLAGNKGPRPKIINISHERNLELSIETPDTPLGPIASNGMWEELYDRLAELAKHNRSTLVFTNTRRLAERVAHRLSERLDKNRVAAHHGSLSRKLRLEAETKLKTGQLQVLVATASLELGIDIGNVDLVCQLGSPRAISIALQRAGRAGHWRGAISKAIFFATTCDELLESAALIYAIRTGDLDRLIIPKEPLDILAQQMVAACATEDWQEEHLFQMMKNSYPYKDLNKECFNELLEMLSSGIAGSRGRYGAYLLRDQVNGVVKARRGSRLAAITSGGAIPETNLFTVITESNGITVGTLDEDFAIESHRGDIILLGNSSWLIKQVDSKRARVFVEDAHGAAPTVPFWVGEAPARTKELSQQLSDLREKIEFLLTKESSEAIAWLMEECSMNQQSAEQILNYIQTGRALLGAVPTQKTLIAERFFDESGGMQLIIHSPFGARINKAWGLALRKRFCRSFNFELQAAATDNGIAIALAEQHSFPLAEVFHFLNPKTLSKVLTQAVLQAPLFKTRWRWAAMRALAILRFRGGRKMPPHLIRILSDDLLAAVFPDAAACQDNLGGKDIELPSHPLIDEAMKDCLTEAMDLEGLKTLLTDIRQNKILCLAIDTPTPSVFSHEILNANPYAFLDDAPLEERRTRAVEMRRVLPDSLLNEIGKLNPSAIKEVQQQAWPDLRNADELHDILQTLVAFPVGTYFSEFQKPEESWEQFFEELVIAGRAGKALVGSSIFWLATEKLQSFQSVYPKAIVHHQLKIVEKSKPEPEQALFTMLQGWMQHLGPTTSRELSQNLRLAPMDIEKALLKLESTGLILRGHYRQTEELEWCERRLLARIHSLTLGILRKEIEPVTPSQFLHWLLRWQHLAPGTELQGEQGVLEVIKQLQGFELPANAWEKSVFSRRVKDYKKEWLDHLCFTGIVGWGRLTPHPSTRLTEEENSTKRISASSVTPICFFVREEAQWLAAPLARPTLNFSLLSHYAQSIYQYLEEYGASFFNDLVEGVGELKTHVEAGLWELVAAGLITADGFDNLRALIDPQRRAGKRGRRLYYRPATGRWSLLKFKKPKEESLTVESLCKLLLKRYGVCFRDLLSKEKLIPSWRELLPVFRQLEARGEIRGGRFVSGFPGEQFALPYAVDSLRSFRKKTKEFEEIRLSAADPLNLIGFILPGKKISALRKTSILIKSDPII